MPSLSLFFQEICHKFHYWNGNFHLYQMINAFLWIKNLQNESSGWCWGSCRDHLLSQRVAIFLRKRHWDSPCILCILYFFTLSAFSSLFSRFHFLFLMSLCFITRVKNIWIKLCVYVFFYTGLNASKIRTVLIHN